MEKLSVGGAPAILSVKLKNGTSYEQRVDYAKGTIQNPMTPGELEDKFRGLASMVLSDKGVENVIRSVRELESLDNIGNLVSLLTFDAVNND